MKPVEVGPELLELASRVAPSVVVVGTGKNVGKTVVVRALCDAAAHRAEITGLISIGRDGEAIDASDALAKPRLFLQSGMLVATAREAIPAHPASEILDASDLQTAAGPILYVRVRRRGFYELVGPPTASGMRRAIDRLFALGAQRVIVDGAVDRVAALAGAHDAVIVATGASNVTTLREAVQNVAALVHRLTIPPVNSNAPFVRVEGGLTPAAAAQFVAEREQRQIVVRDPTQIAIRGKAFAALRSRLDLRCERPLRVIACTVASIGRDRYFEPREFMESVAAEVGVPTFDVYCGTVQAA